MLTKKEGPKAESKAAAKTPKTSASATTETTPKPAAATSKTTTAKPAAAETATPKKTQQKTKITVKFDAGFPNQLYIRGKGANLNWNKGEKLQNVKPDEWVWETASNFILCEFKILINDEHYEKGENRKLYEGSSIHFTPHF